MTNNVAGFNIRLGDSVRLRKAHRVLAELLRQISNDMVASMIFYIVFMILRTPFRPQYKISYIVQLQICFLRLQCSGRAAACDMSA
jgi:hypothetical protein